MSDILDKLAAHARERVEKKEKELPLAEIKERALSSEKGTFALSRALKAGEGIHFICECKKASPSKGLIAEDFPYMEIARDYKAAGASAISVLTEPKWFLGSDDFLKEIAAGVKLPVLRKDFTVSEYMICEAKLFGASAVLLICAILSDEELISFKALADKLGLDCIFEAHDGEEVKRSEAAGAEIIGVNNRNLRDFSVDINNSLRLRDLVPRDKVIFVAESGIKTHEDITALVNGGVQAVLIGETLMRAPDKRAMLDELRYGGK